MPRYEVAIREIEIYSIEVEADSQDKAEEKAWEEFTDKEENRMKYHRDSDIEIEATDLS